MQILLILYKIVSFILGILLSCLVWKRPMTRLAIGCTWLTSVMSTILLIFSIFQSNQFKNVVSLCSVLLFIPSAICILISKNEVKRTK